MADYREREEFGGRKHHLVYGVSGYAKAGKASATVINNEAEKEVDFSEQMEKTAGKAEIERVLASARVDTSLAKHCLQGTAFPYPVG